MILRLLMVVAALLAATPLAARESLPAAPVVQTLSPSEHERLRADMEGQVERLRQDVDKFMAVQDQRIGQLSYFGNFNNGLIALLAVVIAVAAAVLGFKFPKMANLEAKNTLNDWLETEGKKLLEERFAGFRAQMAQDIDVSISQALEAFDQKADPHLKRVMETAELAERLSDLRRTSMTVGQGTNLAEVINDPEKLRAAAATATAKPDEDKTYTDWVVLAWYFSDSGDKATAASRFLRAAACGHSDPARLAQTYLNASHAWADAGNLDAALAALDDLAAHVPEPPASFGKLTVVLCDAGFQKGWCLGELGRLEEAAAAYDAVIAGMERFADHADIVVPVAAARLNSGVILGKQKRHAEALAAYEDLIARYAANENDDVRDSVAWARVNRGRRLMALGRRDEAVVAFREFLAAAGDPSPPELTAQVKTARERLAKLTGGSDGSRP